MASNTMQASKKAQGIYQIPPEYLRRQNPGEPLTRDRSDETPESPPTSLQTFFFFLHYASYETNLSFSSLIDPLAVHTNALLGSLHFLLTWVA
jgi:hypothetical protein